MLDGDQGKTIMVNSHCCLHPLYTEAVMNVVRLEGPNKGPMYLKRKFCPYPQYMRTTTLPSGCICEQAIRVVNMVC